MESNFKELEYKYNAESVRLTDFQRMIDDLKEKYNYTHMLEASSWDIYYIREGVDNDFQRFRNGMTPELTRKFKENENNNWEREEIDLPLDPRRVTEKIVTKYVEKEGYTPKRRIFKSCFIHFFECVNYVYYTVYDEEMNEKGRYIEVEINKDKVNDHSMDLLKEHEKNLATLKITPQNRLRKSLYEIYIK